MPEEKIPPLKRGGSTSPSLLICGQLSAHTTAGRCVLIARTAATALHPGHSV